MLAKDSKFFQGTTILSLIVILLAAVFLPTEAEARQRRPSRARAQRASSARPLPATQPSRYADIVIDGETGLVLHAANAETSRYPASLTKMMTLYLTFQALEAGKLRLNQRLWVSENASSQSPTKLGLRSGQTLRVEDAILGLVTESANDAAVVLAENLGGTTEHFAHMMTRQARALGMWRTQFKNPSGLPDPAQVTTAADMARLGYALVYHYPQFYAYFSRQSFVFAGVTRNNHNRLMRRYQGMDGLKTGYIRTSGFNLVASAVQGQTRLIGAVFGGTSAPARDRVMETLLDQGFAVAPSSNGRRGPVVLVGQQNGDINGDGKLGVGEYLSLPVKNPAIFVPANRYYQEAQAQIWEKPTSASARRNLESVGSNVAVGDAPAPVVVSVAEPSASVVVPLAKPSHPVSLQDEEEPSVVAPQKPSRKTPVAAKQKTEEPSSRVAEKKEGRWGVQIGAYTDPTVGRIALTDLSRRMPNYLDGAEAVLQKVVINNNPVYRARFLNRDERTARAICSQLLQQSKNCLVVRPTS